MRVKLTRIFLNRPVNFLGRYFFFLLIMRFANWRLHKNQSKIFNNQYNCLRWIFSRPNYLLSPKCLRKASNLNYDLWIFFMIASSFNSQSQNRLILTCIHFERQRLVRKKYVFYYIFQSLNVCQLFVYINCSFCLW